MSTLNWGRIVHLLSLRILLPFCAEDRCYDRGASLIASN
jgi:hypothetical protein